MSNSILRPRRGKRSTAIAKDILLKKGEIFFEVPDAGVGTGAGKIFVGDGSTAYKDLTPFIDGTGSIANKIDKVENSTVGDIAALTADGAISDSGVLASSVLTKVDSATAGDVVSLAADGSIADSGVLVSNILSKLSGAVSGNVASISADGGIQDSNISASGLVVKDSTSNELNAKLVANTTASEDLSVYQLRNIAGGTTDIGEGAALAPGQIYIVYSAD